MAQARIDFRRIADAALASLDSLLLEWLPGGRREGHEYKALNPTRGDGRVGSFSINLNTGAWGDFATDEKGGDPISLYAYLQGLSQAEAARHLAERLGIEMPPARKAAGAAQSAGGGSAEVPGPAAAADLPGARKRSEWTPILPVPAEAGDPPRAHIKRGRPEACWVYRGIGGALLGAVYRFRTSDGGKEVLPCVYAEHDRTGAREWRWLSFNEPRPLYGLDRLHDGWVLVVEGEKCADAARAKFPETVSVITWPGGSKAVAKADWMPLKGRKVVIWPDCDAQVDKAGEILPEASQPGIKAAEAIARILAELDCDVRIVKIPAPGAKPSGWDVADAIAEGWSIEQLQAYVRGDNLRHPAAAKELQTPHPAPPGVQGADGEEPVPWVWGERGQRLACASNAYLIFTRSTEWQGVLAFDEFAQRPIKRRPPPYERSVAGEWEEMDDSMSAFWIATKGGISKISSAQAAEGAEMAARAAPFDPVREYLESIAWDGVERCHAWLNDYFGAPQSEYTALAGRMWLIGMVRRVFEPGSKFDYMPILEGPQGRGKSTALEILAHPWFGNTDFVMGDKDSMAVMQGKWLYEVAELDSFNKADSTRVKSFVSRQIDEFRPAYGRRILKLPRRVVLVGTTNQFEYFKDSSGNRRFWPIQCRDQINLDGLRAARDQLLAEAIVRYRDGERCYPTRDEQEAHFTPEQEGREIGDAWEEGVHAFLNTPDVGGARLDRASGFEILTKGLKIEPGKVTREMSTRVGIVMRKLGWTKRERRGENPRYVYERSEKAAESLTGDEREAADVPF